MSARQHFKISRSSEYFDVKELVAQTGQPSDKFDEVILKELIDNALDACETAGIDPVIEIERCSAQLSVKDNGLGMTPELIEKILDFDTRTSDKASYRSPARGAQGNAFKTIIGIPYAHGGNVVIESLGLRHEIIPAITPAGVVEIEHNITDIDQVVGTKVIVTMPFFDGWSYKKLAFDSATLNPHAFVKFSDFGDGELSLISDDTETFNFYKSGPQKKVLPNEPTSAHWYDNSSFNRLLYLYADQNNIPIGEFVRQFRGLKSTAKAKAITKGLGLTTKEVYDNGEIDHLLEKMQAESTPVKASALGLVGKDKMLSKLTNVKRHWYKKTHGTVGANVPIAFEVLIAEADQTGVTYGVNYSAAYGDFLTSTELKYKDHTHYGADSFLRNMGFYGGTHVAIVHLIGIGITFLDRGKSRISVNVSDFIGEALGVVTRALYREECQRKKDEAAYHRGVNARVKAHLREDKSKEVTLKDACFMELPEAIAKSTDDQSGKPHILPSDVRSLFYKCRKLIQKHTDKELNYSYFSQDILIRYWQEKGRHSLIYNDSRGHFFEPHSGLKMSLGTFDVRDYDLPKFQFNKMLYVEKESLWEVIEASGLAQKFDMAVVAAKGYATEAIKVLLGNATEQNITVFCLHDADPDGYEIYRTLQEETERMPDHNIEVIDIGLFLEDALAMGLEPEEFTRKKELSSKIELTDMEREYFEGEKKSSKSWIAKRIELNALSAGQKVKLIEDALIASGVKQKVIPKERILKIITEDGAKKELYSTVEVAVLKIIDIGAIVFDVVGQIEYEVDDDTTKYVEDYLCKKQLETWGMAATKKAKGIIKETLKNYKLGDMAKVSVEKYLKDAV